MKDYKNKCKDFRAGEELAFKEKCLNMLLRKIGLVGNSEVLTLRLYS